MPMVNGIFFNMEAFKRGVSPFFSKAFPLLKNIISNIPKLENTNASKQSIGPTAPGNTGK